MHEPLPYGLSAILVREFIYSGWNRRRRDNQRLEPIAGRRLILHRILWGFHRLVYIDTPDLWVPWPHGGAT